MADFWIHAAALLLACDGARDGVRDGAEALAEARRESRAAVYEPPSPGCLAGASALFDVILAPGPDLARARAMAAALDLEVIEIGAGKDSILVVRETGRSRRGRGFFAFRPGKRRPLAIQAPHSFTDRYTGPLAEKLFVESGAAAAAWNTAERFAERGENGKREEDREREREGEEEDGAADLAHLPESFFQEFTGAFARAHADGIVLQLHGFDAAARGGEGPAAIVSDATRSPGPWVDAVVECIGETLELETALYPRDVRELGGTSNAQAKLLRAMRSRSFLHLELSLDLREVLARDSTVRRRFLLCIPERVP